MHKHHIVPRHMGGSDDPSNIELLTVEEHAERHRVLFEQHGCWQDELAWKGITGLITSEEAAREASRLANIGNKNASGSHGGNSRWAKKTTLSKDMKQRISNTLISKGIKPPTFTGHSQASRTKIAMSNIGTVYVTNGIITKKIKPNQQIPDGFYRGMKKRKVNL